MGLTVNVKGKDGTEFDFECGGYSNYSSFRHLLTEVIRGKAESVKKSKEQSHRMLRDVVSMFGENNEEENRLFSRITGVDFSAAAAAAVPMPSLASFKEPDLDIFLNHSDCNGEFNPEECKKLYVIFKKYKPQFTKMKQKKMTEIYNNFLKAFKSGGVVEYC
jgi:hypothetical protein